VFPETKEKRCWLHKIANVLAALPKSVHPDAKKAMAEITDQLALAQVVDQQITNRSARDAISVDQLGAGRLADAGEHS
jgi:transposase-like protein